MLLLINKSSLIPAIIIHGCHNLRITPALMEGTTNNGLLIGAICHLLWYRWAIIYAVDFLILLLFLTLSWLLVVHNCSPLYRVLIVLAIDALAVTGAENAWLETFAVFLKAGGFFAGAALGMLWLLHIRLTVLASTDLFSVRCNALVVSLWTTVLMLTACLIVGHGATFLGRFLVGCRAYLRSEGIGWLIESLLNCILTDGLEELVILARVTVAAIRGTVPAWGETFTVQLETAWVTTIACLAGSWSWWR